MFVVLSLSFSALIFVPCENLIIMNNSFNGAHLLPVDSSLSWVHISWANNKYLTVAVVVVVAVVASI